MYQCSSIYDHQYIGLCSVLYQHCYQQTYCSYVVGDTVACNIVHIGFWNIPTPLNYMHIDRHAADPASEKLTSALGDCYRMYCTIH